MTFVWSDLAVRYPGIPQNPAPLVSILMIGVICLPLKPLQTLTLGAAMSAVYLGFLVLQPMPVEPLPWYFLLEMAIWVAICTVLTVVLYAQRSSTYKARQQALQSFEDLRRAQARLLLSENSAAQVRLAAALSHELNSPVGVLGSAVNTLLLALKKLGEPSANPSRIAEAVQSIGESAEQSLRRLSDIIRRLQRFTNLDRAEVSVVDVRELLLNAVELLPPQVRAKSQVTLDLASVPPLKCRPQQLNAVFSNLLRNATDSLNGRSGVHVQCGCKNGKIQIRIQDKGQGIPKERMPQLFEPGLAVRDGRVSIANWGLFNCKSIIVEHGGDISVDSEEGQGTTVTVLLPVAPETAPAQELEP
jgi:signal transduction histidine kinase